MRRFLARAAADRKGAAAVEFALIFPILFTMNIGAVEALQVYQAQRNVSHIAATISDITAQSRTVTEAELQDVLSSGLAIIYPFPSTSLQQRVTSITASSSGSAQPPDWTSKRNYASSEAATVPSGYLGANESVIVSDVIYDYKPTFRLFLPATIRFTRHAYARPRLTQKVEKVTS
jgi:Flp pilus assembly protein TadG